MKRTYLGLAVLACSMAVMAQSGSATPAPSPAAPATTTPASPAGPSKVGIIDIQQAIVATNEGARDFEALAKKFEPKRTELQSLNTEIDNLKKQLNTQGDKMNEDARATLVKSIETKQKSLQRSAEDAQNEFQQQQNEVAQRILQKMAPVIDKYAKENGYTLLLDSSNPWPQGPLLWATPDGRRDQANGGCLQRAVWRSCSAQAGRQHDRCELSLRARPAPLRSPPLRPAHRRSTRIEDP